ncbi:MAG: hypothetical protein U1F43_30410, partial [Myxococcota bacterium]
MFLVGLVAFAAGCGQDAVDAALTQQSEGPQLARWLAEGQGGDATGAPDAADAADVTTAPDAVDATVAPDGADGGDTTVLGDATETTATDAVATDAALEVDVAPPPCQGPSDCPDAPPCQKATCVDQVCGTAADP